jgi:PAS domain S-box-containing protein
MENGDNQSQQAAGLSLNSGLALRRRAEEAVREKTVHAPENQKAPSSEETRRVLHELRVHQAELEIQNEQLRQTQMELEVSRERYFDLYDLAPVGYVTLSEKGLFLEANLTASALLGVVRSILLKHSLTRFILPEDQDIYFLHRKQLFKTGQPQAYELRMVKKDGPAFWVRLDTTLGHDADGTPVCLAVISDITSRRQDEELLQLNQANMAHLLRLGEVGEMASGLAHEINQPLCAIANYAHACLRLMETKPNSTQLGDVIKDIRDQAERAGKIVHRIKGLVRKQTPRFEYAGIKTIILEAVGLMSTEAKKRKIRMDLNIPDNLAPVYADFILIEQVILNLIRNGLEAMDAPQIIKKELIIQARAGSNRMIEVCVSDTGCGIPQENMKNIFESFFTTKPDGLGIGLSLCRTIIESHSGQLWAAANAGGGTIFHFTLPTKSHTDETEVCFGGRGRADVRDSDNAKS